jgi:hypothetical protein
MRLGDRHLGVNSVWESGPSGTDGRLPANCGPTKVRKTCPIAVTPECCLALSRPL